ncbi:MAG: LysM peptidoglycan-binding domain-containing protein [Chitinophagales bacterium]|nr:LysM peptidoglycan-binding domain-containing protein [Chitinophagales bacterium]
MKLNSLPYLVLLMVLSWGRTYAQQYLEHTVEWSETIYSIPVHYNMTTKEFLAVNGFSHDVEIKPGMVVKVRELTPEEQFAKKRQEQKIETVKVEPAKPAPVASNREQIMMDTKMKVEDVVPAVAQMQPEPKPEPVKAPVQKVEQPVAIDPDISVGSNGVVYHISKNGLHLVEKQQTAFHIAKIYNLTIDDLLRINNLQSTDIKIGQKLKVQL